MLTGLESRWKRWKGGYKREYELEKMPDRVQEDETGQAGRSDHLHSCITGSSGRNVVNPASVLPDGRKVRNRLEVMKDEGE